METNNKVDVEMQAIGDYAAVLIVKRNSNEDKTKGGIILPEQRDNEAHLVRRGIVISAGPDCKALKGRETVLLKPLIGYTLEDASIPGDVVFVRESDIFCVFKKKGTESNS